jgi:hypothetical protein
MRRTFVFAALVAGFLGLASASISILAAPQEVRMCCGGLNSCDSGKCCERTDEPPCADDNPGFCAPACIAGSH